MEEIQTQIRVVGVFLLLIACADSLLPNGSLRKYAQLGLTVLFVFHLLTQTFIPFQEAPRMFWEAQAYDVENIGKQEIYASAVCQFITQTLKEHGITVQSVQADIHIADDDQICIEQLIIVTDDRTQKQKIQEVLFQTCEIPPQMIICKGASVDESQRPD